MTQKGKSRNADFISIAAKSGYPQPSARRAVKLTNPPAAGRSILRTFPGAAAIKNACHIFMAGIWICCIISNGQNWDSSDNIWNVPFDFLIDIFALSNGSKYFYGNKKKGSDRDVLQCQSLFWPDRNNTWEWMHHTLSRCGEERTQVFLQEHIMNCFHHTSY